MKELYSLYSAWPGESIEAYVDRTLRALNGVRLYNKENIEIACCSFNDAVFYLNLYDTLESGVKKFYDSFKQMNKLSNATERSRFRNKENVKILRMQRIIKLLCEFDTLILNSKEVNQMRRVLDWIEKFSSFTSDFSKDLDSNLYVYKIFQSFDFVERDKGLRSEVEADMYGYYRFIVERFMVALRLNEIDVGLISHIDEWKRNFL